jgi:hypothetical protein
MPRAAIPTPNIEKSLGAAILAAGMFQKRTPVIDLSAPGKRVKIRPGKPFSTSADSGL